MLHSKQIQGKALTRGRENDQENEKRTTNQRERETQRHCRASLLEIEIEHSVESPGTQQCEPPDCAPQDREVRARTSQRTSLMSMIAPSVRNKGKSTRSEKPRCVQLLEVAACACACIKPNSEKKNTARWRDTHGNSLKCTEKDELMISEQRQREQKTQKADNQPCVLNSSRTSGSHVTTEPCTHQSLLESSEPEQLRKVLDRSTRDDGGQTERQTKIVTTLPRLAQEPSLNFTKSRIQNTEYGLSKIEKTKH